MVVYERGCYDLADVIDGNVIGWVAGSIVDDAHDDA